MISPLILILVLVLIAFRQVGGLRLKIWQIMTGGAIAVVALGEISPVDAIRSINADVMVFLAGMFVVGEAMRQSGYLFQLTHRLFGRADSTDKLLIMLLFGMGMLSAFLMNDTMAIIGTPVVLYLSRVHRVAPGLMLLSLAFAVTIGSAMSPIGNPQNLLIAIDGGLENPFVDFFGNLFVPTCINLFIVYILMRAFYRKEFRRLDLIHVNDALRDEHLARLCRISLAVIVLLILLKIGAVIWGAGDSFRLTYIAVAAALPILLSNRRWEILRGIDWETLMFFASMFVLMEAVWRSGFIQGSLNLESDEIASIPMVLGLSVTLSQLVSNVPFVALYLPVLNQIGATAQAMVALAAGSTIAGNLSILGAASNVIIIQNAEKDGATITFMEFIRAGIPLTAANLAVYWLFLEIQPAL
ncbi:MAG TPA: anion transporter [Methanothrix sp.]|nr:anion transporter [Methanothrix sp.]HOK59188.1 anion transporter [Methanothrix sp.]HOL44643.1 anion transporter [Methanothrix sp.]HPO89422.1 anion transporter [Methanothrix sp.]